MALVAQHSCTDLVAYKSTGKRKMDLQSPREDEESSSETATEQSNKNLARRRNSNVGFFMLQDLDDESDDYLDCESDEDLVVESEYQYVP
jgi:hypothetical protein